MILDDLRVIFFHPGKTGGSSVESVLGSYSEYAEFLSNSATRKIFFGNSNDPFDIAKRKEFMMGQLAKNHAVNGVWGTFLQHADIEIFERLKGENNYDDYYKFAFVRNPFDRLLSAYFYNEFYKKYTFEEFIKGGAFEKLHNSVLDKNSHFHTNHLTPQHMYTHRDNEQYVDYIGKLENFNHDLQHVLSELGLKFDKDFPVLAKTQRSSRYKDSMDAYDKEMIDIVGRIYAKDFELFHYRPHQPNLIYTISAMFGRLAFPRKAELR